MKDQFNFPLNCINCNIPTDNMRYLWEYSKERHKNSSTGVTTGITKSFSLPLCNKCFFILLFPLKLLTFLTFMAFFAAWWYIFFILFPETEIIAKILAVVFGLIIPSGVSLLWYGIQKLIEKTKFVRIGKYNNEMIPVFINRDYQDAFLKANKLL